MILPKAKYIYLPHLAMLVSALIWGLVPAVAKIGLQDISPATFLFFRLLIACVIVFPYLFFELKKNPIDVRDIPDIIAMGLASKASILLIFMALTLTSAIDISVISATAPLLAFAAGAYFYREKITRLEILGLLLALGGTFVVVLEPVLAGQESVDGGGKRLLGNILALLYQFSWPIYIILGKNLMGESTTRTVKALGFFHLTKLHKKYSPGLITSLTFFVSVIVFMAASLFEITTASFSLNFTKESVLALLYTSLFSTIIAYNLCTWAMKQMQVQEASIYQYLSVVFAVPAAYFILGEIPTQIVLVGAGLIAAGVIIAERFRS